MTTLKVSNKSNPNSVAGAVVKSLEDSPSVTIAAVGAGAVNQAVKAIAIARGFTAPSGKELVCVPSFNDIEIDGEKRTSIHLTVTFKKNY